MTSKPIITSFVLMALAVVSYYVWSIPKPITPKVSVTPQTDARAAPITQMPKAPDDTLVAETSAKAVAVQMQQPPEMEQVEGVWVKKDRNCTVRIEFYTTEEDGTQVPVHSCKPDNPPPQDIYNTYSIEELKELAYYDAKAAHMLTNRFRETDFPLATDYAIRASALSGDGIYIAGLVNLIPGSAFSEDGTENMEIVEYGYVFSGVAAAFDPRRDFHATYARKARRHEADGVNIETLDARVADMLKKIQLIRSEVGLN